LIGVLIDVVNPLRVKGTGAANDSMNFIAFGKEQFGKIRAVLPRNACDECALHAHDLRLFLGLQFSVLTVGVM